MDAKIREDSLFPVEWGSALSRRNISRLKFLKLMALFSGVVIAGCSPIRILLKDYPKKFDRNPELKDATLRAFVTTVIPGARDDDPNLTRIYTDDYYPFHSYCAFFVSDLSRRSAELYGSERFDLLSRDQRTHVIDNGLQADATITRLYEGAILMTQVSFYGGIYDDDKGCPLIDFHGTNSGFTAEEMCYPDSSLHLAREETNGGNYI